MTKDSGALSIDFLVGFTIFIIAFIWVLSLIPGLLIGLQAHTIDYDAVAYRTGVILVEDPGETVAMNITAPWESQINVNMIARFGLAISRYTPNILSQEKVNHFFCRTVFNDPQYYHDKAIFGDYPYHFNISLRDVAGKVYGPIGDVLPEGYGYIRRLVKIKEVSNATISAHNFINSDAVIFHRFSILINTPRLYTDITDPSYQINPVKDQIMINITDLKSNMSNATSVVTLSSIKIQDIDHIPDYTNISIDGQYYPLPHTVNENVSIKISPQEFQFGAYEGVFDPALYKPIFVNLTFELTAPSTFLNNTGSSPFEYNYDPAMVTQPYLRDAVMEVAIW
jgi:hypothetical protein